MKKRPEILAELHTIQSSLEHIDSGIEVLTVPQNYFEHLPEKILTEIKAAQSETEFQLNIGKEGPYAIPENYFEASTNEILLKVRTLENIAASPTQSFDTIAAKEVFQVPDHYFESFENQLFKKLGLGTVADAKEEIEQLSPLLAELKHKKTYNIPGVDINAASIIEKAVRTKTQPKVIEHPAVKSIKWARWAAAACIIFIFSIGGVKFLGSDNAEKTTSSSFQQAFAKIPDAQLNEWLSNNLDESDINNLSATIVNNKKVNTKSSLKQLSDQEIKDYIENEIW